MPVLVWICILPEPPPPAETTTGAGLRLLFSSQHRATTRAGGIGGGNAVCALIGIIVHTGRGGWTGCRAVLGFAAFYYINTTIRHADAIAVLLIVNGNTLTAAVRHKVLIDAEAEGKIIMKTLKAFEELLLPPFG